MHIIFQLLVEKPRPIQFLTCFSPGKTGKSYNTGDTLSGMTDNQTKDKIDKPWGCHELRRFSTGHCLCLKYQKSVHATKKIRLSLPSLQGVNKNFIRQIKKIHFKTIFKWSKYLIDSNMFGFVSIIQLTAFILWLTFLLLISSLRCNPKICSFLFSFVYKLADTTLFFCNFVLFMPLIFPCGSNRA